MEKKTEGTRPVARPDTDTARRTDAAAASAAPPKKRTLPPSTLLGPLPAVMVSCGAETDKNIITIAWTGIVNSEPPMTYISVRRSRHSHELIRKYGAFVINLTTDELKFATDWCGVKSGRDVDKWTEMHLTPVPADVVPCPMIAEAPVNLECQVVETHAYPSHDMFVAEIVAVHADESLFDEKDRLALEKANLLAFVHSNYLIVPPPKGSDLPLRMGFSVMKPATKKRLSKEAHQARVEANRKKRETKR